MKRKKKEKARGYKMSNSWLTITHYWNTNPKMTGVIGEFELEIYHEIFDYDIKKAEKLAKELNMKFEKL